MRGVERGGIALHTTIFECCREGSECILAISAWSLGALDTPGITG